LLSFGVSEALLILLTLFVILLLFAVLNPAKSLEKSIRNRITDLIIVGLVLFYSPNLKIAGMVVVTYGFGLLLYEKYQEGKREALNTEK